MSKASRRIEEEYRKEFMATLRSMKKGEELSLASFTLSKIRERWDEISDPREFWGLFGDGKEFGPDEFGSHEEV